MAGHAEDPFAKAMLMQFIRLPLGGEMEFFCQRGDGDKIVQRMRVRLSKVKKKAIKARKVPAEFKMLTKEINNEAIFPEKFGENLAGKPATKVVLMKTESGVTSVTQALGIIDEDFAPLIIGNQVRVS